MNYYNGNKLLSYNALFSFVIGGRSIGKSYFFKKKAIKDFLNSKKQFVYLRRYKEELQKTIPSFFDDVKKEFPDVTFSIKSNKFFINGELAGFYFPLSTAHILKSMSFPNVANIYFDEFILDKGTYHYLPKEINAFLNFYDTISRDRDIKVYFIANSITMTNPYFLYFDIQLPKNNTEYRLFKNNLIVLQYVPSTHFIEQRSKTRFGQLIQDTEYGNFSLSNKFILDNNDFIDKKHGKCSFYFAFKYESTIYGVWRDDHTGILYISYDYDPSTKYILSATMSDHSENTLLLKKMSDTQIWKAFLNSYKYGLMRFEYINIKNQCLNLIKSITL